MRAFLGVNPIGLSGAFSRVDPAQLMLSALSGTLVMASPEGDDLCALERHRCALVLQGAGVLQGWLSAPAGLRGGGGGDRRRSQSGLLPFPSRVHFPALVTPTRQAPQPCPAGPFTNSPPSPCQAIPSLGCRGGGCTRETPACKERGRGKKGAPGQLPACKEGGREEEEEKEKKIRRRRGNPR